MVNDMKRLLPLILSVAACGALRADVTLPAIFGDHMVLQQGIRLPVWGRGAPGEHVMVAIGGESGGAIVTPDGTWRVDLPPLPVQTQSQTLVVKGANSITLKDVLIGDVWLASGQSNMTFGIQLDERAADTIANGNQPMIRFFMVPGATSLQPKPDLSTPTPQSLTGEWILCTPQSLGAHMGWKGVSAVAYYFGREIHNHTGQPVGLVVATWVGTPAESWTSVDGLRKQPELAYYTSSYQKTVANLPQAEAAYPGLRAAYDKALADWNKNQKGPKPVEPPAPDGGTSTPSSLFNGMINPLIPYGIKGAIWYQGESNTKSATGIYQVLFPTLIRDWRQRWGEGDFPFLYVQLSNFKAPQTEPSENTYGCWAAVRDAQLRTLSLVPNTGMAVAIDLGGTTLLHPPDKHDVGYRLALAARHVAYGENIVYSGPTYDTMRAVGNQIVIKFKNVGSGLTIGARPPAPNGQPYPVPTKLTAFAVAGSDQKWSWADAAIQGDSVVLSSSQVQSPVAVRYGWASNPSCDLYNKEGLPASPFRTDNWPQ